MSKLRSTFLDAAFIVLKEEGKPMKPHEILEKALARKLIQTTGSTPNNTMSSLLNRNIQRLKQDSLFIKVDGSFEGRFALRPKRAGKE